MNYLKVATVVGLLVSLNVVPATTASAEPGAIAPSTAAPSATGPHAFDASQTLQTEQSTYSSDEWKPSVAAGLNGQSIAAWGVGNDLYIAHWTPLSGGFFDIPPESTDGDFGAGIPGTDPVTGVSADGLGAVAWAAHVGTPQQRVEVTSEQLTGETDFSAPVSVSGEDDAAAYPQLSFGPDDTLAATWLGTSGVWAAVRSPGGSWAQPILLTPAPMLHATPNDPVPEYAHPNVVATQDGRIVVAWYVHVGSGASYRVQTATRSAAGTWGSPVWLSASGPSVITDSAPTLVADSTGGAAAGWMSADSGYVGTLDDTGWSTPTPISTVNGSSIALTAGPDGSIQAVWCHALDSTSQQVRSAAFTPGSGWSSEVVVTTGSASAVAASTDLNGLITATWLDSSGSGSLDEATLSSNATSWGPAAAIPGTQRAAGFSIAADGAGYPLVAVNIADPDATQHTHGTYTLEALVSSWPRLTELTPPTVTGRPAVGQQLRTEPGTWSPAPSSISYDWVWGFLQTPVTTSTYDVRARDAGSRLYPEVSVTAPFHEPTAAALPTVTIAATAHDISDDGIADIAVYRPSNGTWYVRGEPSVKYGGRGDTPVSGSFTYADTARIAVVAREVNPDVLDWSFRGGFLTEYGIYGDIPVTADYRSTTSAHPVVGGTSLAVFRPSNGTWYIKRSPSVQFGAPRDIPVPADYDGVGASDLAVFRPSDGKWFVRGQATVQFGASGDIPVPADYDGSGRADLAVFRPGTRTWYVRGRPSVQFGAPGDIPVPADYNGDGTTDIAVFRPSNGRWYIYGQPSIQFGAKGDIPV